MNTTPENKCVRNTGHKLRLCVTIAIMIAIFVHSAMPADLSSAESGVIVDWLLHLGLFRNNPEILTFIVRKCAHFMEYTVLGFSLWLTAEGYAETDAAKSEIDFNSFPDPEPTAENCSENKTGQYKTGWKFFLFSWLIGTGYAVTDEIHQHFVPGRSCELRDVLIDGCGVAAGILISQLIRHVAYSRSGAKQQRE